MRAAATFVAAFALVAGAVVAAGFVRARPARPTVAPPGAASLTAMPELALPEGDAAGLVVERCQVCHAATMVTEQRLSEPGWRAEVEKMRHFGASLEDDEAASLVTYLAENYGVEAAPFVEERLDPREAGAFVAPEPAGPPGDAARGESLYAANCATCHGDAAQGLRGPALRGRPVERQPRRFGAVVHGGLRSMPSFGELMPAADEADIYAWVAAAR